MNLSVIYLRFPSKPERCMVQVPLFSILVLYR